MVTEGGGEEEGRREARNWKKKGQKGVGCERGARRCTPGAIGELQEVRRVVQSASTPVRPPVLLLAGPDGSSPLARRANASPPAPPELFACLRRASDAVDVRCRSQSSSTPHTSDSRRPMAPAVRVHSPRGSCAVPERIDRVDGLRLRGRRVWVEVVDGGGCWQRNDGGREDHWRGCARVVGVASLAEQ